MSAVPYLPGLDGMRALAVVAVMVYHANSAWLPGGFLGVEVFFVISGYLITLLLIGEHERTGTVSLRDFYVRRARRLLPALFTLLIGITVYTALLRRDALGQLRGDVIAALAYVSNWYQIWVGQGYTATGRLRAAAAPVVAGGGGAVLPDLAGRDDPAAAGRAAAPARRQLGPARSPPSPSPA